MSKTVVLSVPQWQGSGAALARRLAEAPAVLAAAVAADRIVAVDVPEHAGPVRDAVRSLDVLLNVVRATRAELMDLAGDVVVTIGGDCGVELAPIAAAVSRYGRRLAVVWFDAHGDLNTPESSPSGAFHGMVLRTLLGDGHAELVPPPGHRLRPEQVVLAGVRALDEPERAYRDQVDLSLVPVDALRDPATVIDAIDRLDPVAVYLHIDTDVLDPAVFGSASYPEPDGVLPQQLIAAASAIARRWPLAGLGVTEFQRGGPPADERIIAELIESVLPE